jgi:hypothetical protein
VSFQRGREAWLAEFEKRWGRNNEAALVVRPTLRVQSNAEMCTLSKTCSCHLHLSNSYFVGKIRFALISLYPNISDQRYWESFSTDFAPQIGGIIENPNPNRGAARNGLTEAALRYSASPLFAHVYNTLIWGK